jgi:hypothetical protein
LGGQSADQATHAEVPTLRVAMGAPAVLDALLRRSQQGKLPGFRRADSTASGPPGFVVDIQGTIYDRDLIGSIHPALGGSEIRFTSRLRRRLPWIVIVVTVLTFWPGVLLTDSLLTTWFSWYPKQMWVTAAWYLPLCVLTIPVLWKQYKASEKAAEAHLRETLAKLAAWLAPPNP